MYIIIMHYNYYYTLTTPTIILSKAYNLYRLNEIKERAFATTNLLKNQEVHIIILIRFLIPDLLHRV